MRFRARSAGVEGSGRWIGDNSKNPRFVGGLVFRSDVVGSRLRPAFLKKAREQHEARQIGDAEFKSIEDRAVDEAVELQRQAGADVITDGEMRRYAFYGHLIDAVDGFDMFGGWAIPFRNEKGEELVLPRPVVVSKLRRKRPLCAEEFTYLRARTNHPAKTTMISAQQAAAYYDGKKSAGAYPKIDAYRADLVDILRDEVEELVRLGCSYIQIDSPQYAALLDPQLRDGYRQRGNDPDRLLDISTEMDNAVIAHHPGVTFGLHLCRGNNQSRFYASGDYGPITKVFERTRFQRFLLEYDDERSGRFEPLGRVPEDRTVVLGLVSSKKAALESKKELKRRTDDSFGVHLSRETCAKPAVRIRFDDRRQPPEGERSGSRAAPGGGDSPGSLELRN